MAKKKEIDESVAIAGNILSNGIVLPTSELVTQRYNSMCATQFPQFNELVSKLNVTVVTNETTLDTAERNIKEATTQFNKIEAFRKDKQKQFKEVVDTINNVTKNTYTDVLTLAKANATKRVTTYRVLQAAAKAVEVEKQTNEANKLEKKLDDDRKTVDSRIKMASAKVFGGTYIKHNGDPINYPMLSTIEDCRKAIAMFSDKYPITGVDETLQTYLRVIRDLSIRVIKDMIDILTRDEDVANRISGIKQQFDEEIETTRNRIGIKIEKTVASVTKVATSSYNQINKGIKVNIKWSVIDLSKVPVEFLQLNEEAIRKYTQNDNREVILKKIKDGKNEEIIDGLEFTTHSDVVVR